MFEDEDDRQVCTSTGGPLKKIDIIREKNDKKLLTSTGEPLKKKEKIRDKKGKRVHTYTDVLYVDRCKIVIYYIYERSTGIHI